MEWLALGTLFLLGLSFGMTACTFACLPFLAPLLVRNSASLRETFGVVLPFSMGRVAGYSALAAGAFYSAEGIRTLLKSPEISQAILGGSTILLAVYLLAGGFGKKRSCGGNVTSRGGYFVIGAAMALNPCAPVMTLIGFAVNTSHPLGALAMGLVFGLGAVAFSILFYGFLIGRITGGVMEQFTRYKRGIERTAAVLLLLLGVLVFNGVIKL